MFILFLGIAVLALGIHSFKNPESWMNRSFWDNNDPSDTQLSYYRAMSRARGKVNIILGIIVTLGGILRLIN